MKNQIPQKMGGTSLNISKENKEKLKLLLPSVFTETTNEKGEMVECIDFEKLKAELGTFSEYFENRKEHYGMDWPGKKEALKLIQTTSAATLKPNRDESVNFDTTENLYIEGDNLEVLKLLQKSYYGKVKMIYIDPPYNTGKEFIYPDNFTESLDTYLEYAGLVDGEGKKFSTNTANEGRFHTKWLNMMYPRLYLARNLLKDDGVIFISIDDNEAANLRKICDEIYGEDNFLANFKWNRTAKAPSLSMSIRTKFEYVLCYKKNKSLLLFGKKSYNTEAPLLNISNRQTELAFPPKSIKLPRNFSPGTFSNKYEVELNENIQVENELNKNKFSLKARFKWSQNKVNEYIRSGKYFLVKNDLSTIYYYMDTENSFIPPSDLISDEECGVKRNTDAKEETKNLGIHFDYAKPVSLIKYLIKTVTFENKNALILDFFAGSGTTGHAVLDINREDNGDRKFIMVQLPEPCAEDSEAFKAGYKTISDIGKERIRRVIKKLNNEDEGKLDLTEGKKQDRGFKVLKLDMSNFKQWQALEPNSSTEKIEQQLEMNIDHIDKKATPEDLLYEVLIKAGFLPTEKIEKKTIAGKQVFSIADGALLICFEDKVTKELIEEVSKTKPMQFICLDSAFGGNDQLKANAVQTFRSFNQGKEKEEQIIFKTI